MSGAVGEAIQIGLFVLISIASVVALLVVGGRPHLVDVRRLDRVEVGNEGGTSRAVYRFVAVASPVTSVFLLE